MPLPQLIGILTPELVCFHEAGHVVTAATIGARVAQVSLLDGPPPHGISSIERTPPQAPFIACGGLAAEHFLFEKRRLVDGSGRVADASLFLSEAQKNAQEDVQNYVKGMVAMNARVDDPMMDFGGTALGKVYPNIDFKLVEEVAADLFERKVLDEARLAEILGSNRSLLRCRYKLQRMIGFSPIQSAYRAARGLGS
ncbi:hypothetical protein [Bradyrhizobium sp. CCBAU 45384]|uniref:hypothetical protein n=1 Tax=Bradyrhizobium sp. CCBAU 45384 TaxID=858428 RepID=UPI0023063354|nr:hypothetical protein [Bradyrhizobium sp. CCBAU 45384]MDA9409811.1 hypothetical protein [Bradyrhizobium sp. CCBAU 45384]